MDAFDTFLLKEWTCQGTSMCCTKAEISGKAPGMTPARIAICKQGTTLKFQGMIRDWLFICYAGSISSLLGALWLS